MFSLSSEQLVAFNNALSAMTEFKKVFKRSLDDAIVAEIYAAKKLDLRINQKTNEPGYDLTDSKGVRFQVKCRNRKTRNVDVNSFDFCYLVLVNLGDNYELTGMWRLSVEKAREIFVYREKHRKFQATQKRVKENAESVF